MNNQFIGTISSIDVVHNSHTKKKIAAFDLDWTIIRPKYNKKFPTNKNDWVFINNKIRKKINKLLKDDYYVVIFSNQGGILYKKQNVEDIIYKFNYIIKKIKYKTNQLKNVSYVISYKYNKYRKPNISMFSLYLSKLKITKDDIDYNKSFYCGDASGREKDFSNTDKQFALNIKFKFHTPEEFLDIY